MSNLKSIKGTKDLLPNDTLQWREIENIIHNFMNLHGYGEIRTPVFEKPNYFCVESVKILILYQKKCIRGQTKEVKISH